MGIDITPRVGRLVRPGDGRVRFEQKRVEDVEQTFDLVLMCDVMHHVPLDARDGFMKEVGHRAGRALVVKDWERTASLIHLLAYCSDRFITQDRIAYYSADELESLVASAGLGRVTARARIAPWFNNIAMMAKR